MPRWVLLRVLSFKYDVLFFGVVPPVCCFSRCFWFLFFVSNTFLANR